jgi:hypothetical protein
MGEIIIFISEIINTINRFPMFSKGFGDGTTGQLNTITLQAQSETRPLNWLIQEGTLNVWNPNGAQRWFNLFFGAFSQMTYLVGSNNDNNVDFVSGTIGTETYFSFPSATSNSNEIKIE